MQDSSDPFAPGTMAPPHPGRAGAPRDMPRERLFDVGPAALSDTELVAIFLGSGLPGYNVFEVARALLLNPQILMFDEPTSSMDNSTEAAFKQRLGTIAKGRTIVLVTHRHSMLALVDRLIVLDRGKVVADGPKAGVLEALMGGRVQARE